MSLIASTTPASTAAPTEAYTAPTPDRARACRARGLRDVGYAQGRNLVVERRTAEGDNDRHRALAAELVRLPVELIVAPGTAASLAAKEATSTIPIVVVLASWG